MAKISSTPLEQTARLLDLVPFLLTHQGISLADLAKHFKVDSDVMLDDLNTLWMCGLPGYTPLELIDLDFDSGYVTIRNAAPLAYIRTMSSSELVALVLGLDLLLEDALSLSLENRERIVTLSQKIRNEVGSQISITPSSQTSHRSVISTAIAHRKTLAITYYSPTSDESSDRVVTPYHFFQEGQNEYFEGFCHKTMAMRTFRLDRVIAAKVGEAIAAPSQVGQGTGEPIRVVARIHTPDLATAESFGLSHHTLQAGGQVEVGAFSQEWLLRTVLATGGALEVESPIEIRELISLCIKETLALYE